MSKVNIHDEFGYALGETELERIRHGDEGFYECDGCKEWFDEEADLNNEGRCKKCQESPSPGDLSDQMYDQARDDEAMAETRLEATGMFPRLI